MKRAGAAAANEADEEQDWGGLYLIHSTLAIHKKKLLDRIASLPYRRKIQVG
jgi:hypothetical protein